VTQLRRLLLACLEYRVDRREFDEWLHADPEQPA
jgi:hypothetical protein